MTSATVCCPRCGEEIEADLQFEGLVEEAVEAALIARERDTIWCRIRRFFAGLAVFVVVTTSAAQDFSTQTYFRIGDQVMSETNGFVLTRNVLEVNAPIPKPEGTFQRAPGRILLEFSSTNAPDVWLFQFLNESAGPRTNGYKIIHRAGRYGEPDYQNTILIARTNVFTLHMAEFAFDRPEPLTGETNATLRSVAIDFEGGELRFNSFWNEFLQSLKNDTNQTVVAFE